MNKIDLVDEMKVFIYQWITEAKPRDVDKSFEIRGYGISEDGTNVCLEVENFQPWLCVELKHPHKPSVKDMKQCLQGRTFSKITLTQKTKLYFYQHEREFPIYKVYFRTDGLRKRFYYSFQKASRVRCQMKDNQIKIHECDASPILQFLCSRDLPSCGWVEFIDEENCRKHDKNGRVTRSSDEYIVDNKRLRKYVGHPTIPVFKSLSFDLEVYSHDENRMPSANHVEDVIFQIGVVVREAAERECYLFTLAKQELKLTGCHVKCFSSEKELLKGFLKFLTKANPHILLGYNIFGFDLPYLVQRCRMHSVSEIYYCGMPRKLAAEFKEVKWSSSAYQCQEFKYLDYEGRIFVDLLPIVRRSYKFSNYRLKTVSDFFLGETKDPLTARDIFRAYRLDFLQNGNGSRMKQCGKYCLQDSRLVCKLFEKLQCWIELIEMAKICNVGIMPLFTQGQQIKIYSQVYRKCFKENRLVDSFHTLSIPSTIQFEMDDYQGAYVFPPDPGLYSWVLPFDFSSLYPTTQIAYNIDYSTLVIDESVPDEKCNIVEWKEDNGNSYRYRFIKEPLGVIPSLLKSLLDQRNETKKKLKLETDETLRNIYDKQQLAYKVSANSMYGGMGVKKGYLPFLPGAICTTAKGRESIQKAAKFVQEQHKGKIVYGDSVTPNTFLYIKNIKGEVHIVTIEQLFSKFKSIPYPQFKPNETDILHKEQCLPNNILIGTRNGWANVKRVIRHVAGKSLYRIWSSAGMVEVTEDHSLLLEDNTMIRPSELVPGRHVLKTNTISSDISKSLFYNKEKWKGLWQIHENEISFHSCTDNIYMAYIYFRFYQFYPESRFVLKNDEVFINLTNSNNIQKGLVYRVEAIPVVDSEFVYDIETTDGSFHCGLGDIVVKNTDSIYVHFPKYQNAPEVWEKAKRTEHDFLPLFPPPMKLLFEEKIYKDFLILSKKRYMAYTCDASGTIDEKMTIRGVLLARRDNCQFVRTLYEKIVRLIMEKHSLAQIVNIYNQIVLDLFQWKKTDINEFVISKLLNAEYKIKELPEDYTKVKKRLTDLSIHPIPTEDEWIEHKKHPEKNPSWYKQYTSRALPAHKQLADRQQLRGFPISAGSRIEYVVIEHYNDIDSVRLFDKIEDPDYMLQHADVLRLDRLYYLKASIIPLDQLLNTAFKSEKDESCFCRKLSMIQQIALQIDLNREKNATRRKQKEKELKQMLCQCHSFGKRLYQIHFDHFKLIQTIKTKSQAKLIILS